MNYFEILKLPVKYQIDSDELTKNYLVAQKNFGCEVDLLNEAYNVLKSDIKRGEYFLGLHDISVEKLDKKFATEMFELREKYSTLISEKDKIDFQKKLKSENKKRIASLDENNLEKFSELFSVIKFVDSFLEKVKLDVYSRN